MRQLGEIMKPIIFLAFSNDKYAYLQIIISKRMKNGTR